MDRHRGRLGAFDMKVEYVPGNPMPCDYGSRHPEQLPDNLTKRQREELGIETEEEDEEIEELKAEIRKRHGTKGDSGRETRRD